MQHVRSQTGFTMVEVVIVLAIIGVFVAFAVPSFTRYRNSEEAKANATEIGAALRDARSLAMKEGVPYFVIFNPTDDTYNVPAGNPAITPGTAARIVRDADADSREDTGERVRDVVPRRLASSTVSAYIADGDAPFEGANRIPTDSLGGTLAGIVNGANFAPDPISALPAVLFNTRGMALVLQSNNVNAGSYYVTDNALAVYAASVRPLGEVRIRALGADGNWR